MVSIMNTLISLAKRASICVRISRVCKNIHFLGAAHGASVYNECVWMVIAADRLCE